MTEKRFINCDQVAWMLAAIGRYLQNSEPVSRAQQMQAYGLLYEVMEVANLQFEDSRAAHNGTPPDVRLLTPKDRPDGYDLPNKLSAIARGMSYDGSTREAQAKHRLMELVSSLGGTGIEAATQAEGCAGGMTIAGEGAAQLGKLMAEQARSPIRGGPAPYA